VVIFDDTYLPFVVVRHEWRIRIEEHCDDGVRRDLYLNFWRWGSALKVAQALYWARKNALSRHDASADPAHPLPVSEPLVLDDDKPRR
jgi:hypothetical protein